jgi:ribA/ribD-fused uncharacterized protein
MAIKFYKTNEPYGFLNNFKKARMFIVGPGGGRWCDNVETAYQAAKTVILEDEEMIWAAKTPREARDLGQKIKLRGDWNHVKDDVMYQCVLAKFLQHADLRAELMATGNEELIEDSPVDWYWGCGKDGTGKNMLGKTLMRVRKELQGE